jgi:C1A family cysteine protease
MAKDAPIVVIHGQERKLDWIPDKPDQRDLKFGDPRLGVFKAGVTPDEVNLTGHASPIRDQGRLGSCTGFSLAGQMEHVWALKPPGHKLVFSPQFIYWNEREEENSIREDSGAYIRDGSKVLAAEGVCLEKTWPYKDTMEEMVRKPSDAAVQEAVNYRVGNYYRIQTLDQMLDNLAQGYSFTFGISLYDSFQADSVTRTGVVPMPGTREAMIGGHAITAMGYSKRLRLLLIRNSWSTSWGKQGYFFLPFAYIEQGNNDLWDDAWTFRAAA